MVGLGQGGYQRASADILLAEDNNTSPPRCGANSVKGVTALRGGNFVVAVVVTGGVTVFPQNPDFVVVEVVVVAKS